MEDVGSSTKRKRIRNPNWDDAEKNLLRECLKDKLDAIENKSTDTNTNHIKKIAWQIVFESFNELNTKQRSLTEIKQQWRTLKINANKSYSSFRKTLEQTGEDEPPPSPNTVDILETFQVKFEEGVDKFHCDNITHNVSVTKIEDTDDTFNSEELQDEDFIKDQPPTKKSATETFESHLIKTSSRKRQKMNEELKVMSKNRKERDMALITFLREEHELKMEHMANNEARAQEEHVLRVKHLELQNKLLEKQLSKHNE